MAIRKTTSTESSIKMEILEKCGVIMERSGGYSLELRYISWNGKDPRYDIRPWKVNDEGEEVCGKGITLSGEELEKLGGMIAALADEENGEKVA